jgi:predicted RND superfamily exporter protein
MNPSYWGPHAWVFLHCVTMNYPSYPTKNDKDNMKNFFYSLKNVLPCDKCKYNFGTHIKEIPLTDNILSSKKKLINWLIDIHNSVNKMNNKPTLTYDEVVEKMMDGVKIEKNVNKEQSKIKLFLVVFIILIFLFIFLYLYIKNKK